MLTLQARSGACTRAPPSRPREALRWLDAGEHLRPRRSSTCTCRRWTASRWPSASAMRGPTCRCVLFSSLGRREAGDDEALFAAYLAKPVRQSQLSTRWSACSSRDAAPEAAAQAKAALDPELARPPSAAHPARRGQRREPEARAAPPAAAGLPGRPRVATASRRSNRSSARPTTSCSWTCRCPRWTAWRRRAASRALERRAPAHRRDDRQRDAGRPRDVPRGRHGRLHHQADPRRAAGRSARRCAHARKRCNDRSTIDVETFAALRDATGAEFVARAHRHVPRPKRRRYSPISATSLATGDAERFRRAAHSLKSNGNTFGALTLGELAKDLELARVAHVKERGPSALADIEAEYLRVAAALAALRDE